MNQAIQTTCGNITSSCQAMNQASQYNTSSIQCNPSKAYHHQGQVRTMHNIQTLHQDMT